VRVGAPKVPLEEAELSRGVIVESPAKTAIIKKSLKDLYTSQEYAKLFGGEEIKGGLWILRKTETTKSKFIQKQFIKETKTLSEKGAAEVLKFAKKEKADLYGSFGARQQMPTDLARTPADIDVQLQIGAEEAATKTQQLVKRLKQAGEKVRVSERSPTLIEAKTNGEWHHAVDIHSSEEVLADTSSPVVAREKAYGLRLGQKPIKIEETKVMPLSEQAIRKGASIFTVREKGFAPEAHRTKDIGDFFTTTETLARSKLFGGKTISAELEKLKGLYPAEVFGKPAAPTGALVYTPEKPSPAKEKPPSGAAAGVVTKISSIPMKEIKVERTSIGSVKVSEAPVSMGKPIYVSPFKPLPSQALSPYPSPPKSISLKIYPGKSKPMSPSKGGKSPSIKVPSKPSPTPSPPPKKLTPPSISIPIPPSKKLSPPPSPRPSPPPTPPYPFITPPPPPRSPSEAKKQKIFDVKVRRRGVFRPVGRFKTAREAILKGKVAVEKLLQQASWWRAREI